MHEVLISLAAVAGTIGAYLFAAFLYRRFYTPLLLPVAIATLVVILFLLIFQVDYATYMSGAKWIDGLLGPAVVSLAYPLYQNRHLLKKLAVPLVSGTLAGSFIGIASGVFFAKMFAFEDIVIYSLAPKSVTTPVAMDISETLTGISSLAAVFVMIAGISGAMLSTVVFRWIGLRSPAGRGVALGSASHAIGTARSLEKSLEEGSISTVAMILCAIFVSIMAPILVGMLI